MAIVFRMPQYYDWLKDDLLEPSKLNDFKSVAEVVTFESIVKQRLSKLPLNAERNGEIEDFIVNEKGAVVLEKEETENLSIKIDRKVRSKTRFSSHSMIFRKHLEPHGKFRLMKIL